MNQLSSSRSGMAMNNSGIKNMFNKGTLQQMIGASQYLPSQPVQPGDTWPIQANVEMGEMGSLTGSNNITLAQWEKHGPRLCARLEFDRDVREGKPAENPNPMGMSMAIQDGTTLPAYPGFDPELGTVIDADVHQDLQRCPSPFQCQPEEAASQPP